jgi:hypothetical protein
VEEATGPRSRTEDLGFDVGYLPEGGDTAILSRDVPRPYRVFDSRTGKVLSRQVEEARSAWTT